MGLAQRLPRPFVQLARPVLDDARFALQLPEVLRFRRGLGPGVVLMPSGGRAGASLLRVHLISNELRRLGWRCLTLSPRASLSQRHKILKAVSPDVVLMQGSRHALNRPRLYPGYRIAYDLDDADFHLPHLAASVRRAMPEVDLVIAGSRYIADWAMSDGAPAAKVVWTGAPVSETRPQQVDRSAIVAWAQTRPETYTHEAELVRRVLRRVAAKRPGVTLRLYDRQDDADDGFRRSFTVPGLSVEWERSMPYGRFLNSLDDVAIGLAPLCTADPFVRGKSFGKALAYLDRGVPIVASDAAEHAQFFTPETGVISNDEDVWVTTILKLLDNPKHRQTMANAALGAFQDRLSIASAGRQVSSALQGLLRDDAAVDSG